MASESRPWYADEQFFGDEYLRQYEWFLTAEKTAAEIDAVERLLDLAPGAAILDVPCGYGRHSIELARRGYRVTGQDLSGSLLDRARQGAADAEVAVDWIRRDMREIEADGDFDAVVNLFTSFGYFDDPEDDARVCHSFSRALRPGGRVLFEGVNREFVIRHFQAREWLDLPDGSVLTIERAIDLDSGVTREKRVRIDPDGERRVFEFSVRFYTLNEWRRLLGDAGLEIDGAYGGLEDEPLTFDSPRLALVARKPG